MNGVPVANRRTGGGANLRAVLLAGLAAGALDLSSAFLVTAARGGEYARMLQGIASGLLGSDGFQGGGPAAALGVVLHFGIALLWAAVFFLASRRVKFLTARPVVSGVLYGVAVYFLMYYVVVPLSAAPFQLPRALPSAARDVLIHVFCVGLPIALVTRRFAK